MSNDVTVGQLVHYYPGTEELARYNPNVNYLDGRQPMAALVCFVHKGEFLNLSVFDHMGKRHLRASVPRRRAELRRDAEGRAMPSWEVAGNQSAIHSPAARDQDPRD